MLRSILRIWDCSSRSRFQRGEGSASTNQTIPLVPSHSSMLSLLRTCVSSDSHSCNNLNLHLHQLDFIFHCCGSSSLFVLKRFLPFDDVTLQRERSRLCRNSQSFYDVPTQRYTTGSKIRFVSMRVSAMRTCWHMLDTHF